jgi:hypothetical protein
MKTVQLNNVNCAIVKDNVSWMSGKELMFIRDVMSNNHKSHPVWGISSPNSQDFLILFKLDMTKEYGVLIWAGLCE